MENETESEPSLLTSTMLEAAKCPFICLEDIGTIILAFICKLSSEKLIVVVASDTRAPHPGPRGTSMTRIIHLQSDSH